MSARPIDLVDARDEANCGGKAVQLGAALRGGLPVPSGFALDAECVDAIVAGDAHAITGLRGALARAGGPVAVRSSAVGEDSVDASFAGMHRTLLYVRGDDAVARAIADVHASAHTDAALAYRTRLGLPSTIRIAVVVQRMVAADRAGVLFTRDPITGRDERVIESSWGLGEAIVSGMITPDRHRVARDGRIVERVGGDKDIELLAAPAGGVETRSVDAARAAAFCLSDDDVRRLHDLADGCERVFGSDPADIEWAFAGSDVFLLQRRKMTR